MKSIRQQCHLRKECMLALIYAMLRLRKVRYVLIFIATGLSFTFGAFAQDSSAIISGEVRDSSQAVVWAAQVELLSVERKTRTSTKTNDAGVFRLEGLRPGGYELTIEQPGFRTFVQKGIVVVTNDHLGFNITLQLGSTSEQILVTDAPSQVQTEDGSISTVLQNQAIERLPIAGGNLFQLEFALPGVTKAATSWGSFQLYAVSNVNNISIGGGLPAENEIILDGASDTLGTRAISYVPPMAATQELTVRLNQFDAAAGRLGGGVTNFSLKSGTNQFHGQLFEFLENSALSSNSWLANHNGVKVSHATNNQYGFEVAGPVWVPHVFDGRKKAFFMLSLEGLRFTAASPAQATLPTLANRSGDFSSLVDAGGKPVTIYDPLTVKLNSNGTYSRTPFKGNIIPKDRINPIAAAAIAYYPAPTQLGGVNGLNNFFSNLPSVNRYDAWLGRFDANVTDNSAFTVRYGQTPWYNQAQLVWATNAAEPSKQNPSTRTERNGGFEWRTVFSPALLLTVSGAVTRYETFGGNGFGDGFDPKQLGFAPSVVSHFSHLQFPYFNMGSAYSQLGAIYSSNIEALTSYVLHPSLAWLHGRQYFHFGFDARRYDDNISSPGAASGEYDFSRAWTQANPTQADSSSGNEIASFLLGYMSGGNLPVNIAPMYRNYYWAGYVQDDVKLLPNLTINAGLRWDYESPMGERRDRQIVGFNLGQASPLAGKVATSPNCPACGNLQGGLQYSNVGENPALPFNRYFTDFGPRVGLAFSPDPHTVLRGGYGLMFLGQSSTGPSTGFSATTTFTPTADGGITPDCTLSDPLCEGVQTAIGSSQGTSTYLGQSVSAPFRARPLPYSQQYSIGFQHEFKGHWLAEMAYAGNITSRIPQTLSLNFLNQAALLSQPAPQRASYFSASVQNPFAGLLPNSSLNRATVSRAQLLYAFPQYSAVSLTDVPIGWRRYDALQSKLVRRYEDGLTFNLGWTWSKTFERASVLNPFDVNVGSPTQTKLEKRLSQYDATHTVSGVITYELPVGRGRRLGSGMNRFADAAVGGWNISGTSIFRTGFPVGGANACPTMSPARIKSFSNIVTDTIINTAAFPDTALSAYDIRTCESRLSSARFPNMVTTDASLSKQIAIRDGIYWQIRADAYNAFNHPWFSTILSSSVTSASFGFLNQSQNNDPRLYAIAMKILF
jgi:hypothetical protein